MVKQGDELTAIIWEMALVHEGEGPKGHFPQYKGFELLLNFLLKTMRIHGGSKRTVLGPLKMSLSSDLKWEKKLLAEYKDGIFQFFLTGLITWIFAIFSSWILDLQECPVFQKHLNCSPLTCLNFLYSPLEIQ